jgi:hypothetical protein
MKVIKNNISKFFIVSLLLGSIDSALASQQLEQKQPEQASSKLQEPVLSEKEIVAYLQSKFASLQVDPDVDIRYVARMLNQKTQKDLDLLLDNVAKLAEQDSSKSLTMQHIRSVARPRYDDVTNYLMYLILFNKKAVAIHEAAHADVMASYLSDYVVVDEVSLVGNQEDGYVGVTRFIPRFSNYDHVPDKDNSLYVVRKIMSLLSGYIAQELFELPLLNFFGNALVRTMDYSKWFTSQAPKIKIGRNDFDAFLLEYSSTPDIKQIYGILEHVMFKTNWNETEAKEFLRSLYEEIYDIIAENKDEIEKIANVLEQEHHIIGKRLYDLLDLPMPKFDFEQEAVVVTETENLSQPVQNKVQKKVVPSKSRPVQHKKGKK